MAEANGDQPDCDNCNVEKIPDYACQLNFEAVKTWRLLDIYGRDIDTFSGVPRALRLEAIDIECNKSFDPEGLKWRVLLIEEHILSRRIKKYNVDAEKRNKGKK